MEIWRSLEAGSCGLEWLIQRRREVKKDMWMTHHMIAIMNVISVHVQVINAEPCDLAAGKMKNVKSNLFTKAVIPFYNFHCPACLSPPN